MLLCACVFLCVLSVIYGVRCCVVGVYLCVCVCVCMRLLFRMFVCVSFVMYCVVLHGLCLFSVCCRCLCDLGFNVFVRFACDV